MGASKIAEGSSTSRSFLPSRSRTSTFIVTLLQFLHTAIRGLLLSSLFDDDQTTLASGHCAMETKQIALRIHQHNFQRLHSHTLAAHVPRAACILIDSSRRCTCAA